MLKQGFFYHVNAIFAQYPPSEMYFLLQDVTTIYTHTDINSDHGDEGKVQLFKVETKSITDYDIIFITVWAVNKVSNYKVNIIINCLLNSQNM